MELKPKSFVAASKEAFLCLFSTFSGSYKEVKTQQYYHIYTNPGIYEDRVIVCIQIYISYINVGADVRLVVAARSWKGTSTTPCKSLACVCDFT